MEIPMIGWVLLWTAFAIWVIRSLYRFARNRYFAMLDANYRLGRDYAFRILTITAGRPKEYSSAKSNIRHLCHVMSTQSDGAKAFAQGMTDLLVEIEKEARELHARNEANKKG